MSSWISFAFLLLLVMVAFWVRNWLNRKIGQYRKQLELFIAQGKQLKKALAENLNVQRDYDNWVKRVEEFLSENFDERYILLFSQYRGMRSHEYEPETAKMANSIQGRLCRLIDFTFELRKSKFYLVLLRKVKLHLLQRYSGLEFKRSAFQGLNTGK